jgi:hypothetical protein
MTYETELFAALAPLAALTDNGRAYYVNVFPQRGEPSPWPAIRTTVVSGIPEATICGNGNDEETDFRVQIDGIAATAMLRTALRLAIQGAMAALPTPCLCDNFEDSFDVEARGYRTRLDYLLLPSSPT